MSRQYSTALQCPGVAAVFAPDNSTFCELDDRHAVKPRNDATLLQHANMIADLLNGVDAAADFGRRAAKV